MFFKIATKTGQIVFVDLTRTTLRQINGEYFINFCGLPRKREL